MKRKAISSLLCVLAIMQMSITPAYATNTTQQTSTPGNQSATITYDQGSKFTVTIPKTIALDKTKTDTYSVKVEGDISADEAVTVTPDATVAMTDTNNKNSVTGTITQEKTKFVATEVNQADGTSTTGTITANDLTAGNWSGQFNFYINVDANNSGNETSSKLTLSTDNVALGANDSVQVNAYVDNVVANESVSWNSNNENITVSNGLVQTKANVKAGDTAIVTVNKTSDTALLSAENDNTAQFKVTVIDIAFTTEADSQTVSVVNIKPGESKAIEASIIPQSVSGTVKWSTTASAGLNLTPKGNTVTLNVADDMEVGKTYDLIATYGTYSKVLKVNIVGDTDNIELAAGLYDDNNHMLASWDDLVNTYGLNIQKDYKNNTHTTTTSHLYYILNNNEEFANATNLVIDSSVLQIGDNALYGCTQMTKVTIPDSVLRIGWNAFQGCKLKTIDIPSSVDSIENNAFAYSSTLTKAVIGARVIGKNAFYNNEALVSLELKDGVEQIGSYAFANASNLEGGLEFPDTLTKIDNCVFQNCSKLTSAYMPSSITDMNYSDPTYSLFYGCSSSLTAYCEPANQQWHDNWQYCSKRSQIKVKWDVKRAIYEALYK